MLKGWNDEILEYWEPFITPTFHYSSVPAVIYEF
jgi:hypothetical protein